MQAFDLLFHDEHFVAINKPKGILVHRTKISEDNVFVLQRLRNQIKQRIYPVHRLDRATSGVLIFGKTKASAHQLAFQFSKQNISKTYIAIVRGFVEKKASIQYPLKKGSRMQEAITHYELISQTTIDVAISRYPSSRYSFVKIVPQTGKWHQIRRHFAHIRHPIIGDKRHGDCKHNKYFREVLGIERMLLHALDLSFFHPERKEVIKLTAPTDEEFKKALEVLRFRS